jgi:3-(3-hydroxy-phenyl)propionate hydroxylase
MHQRIDVCDVVVVGAGPVGLALARLLVSRGVTVAIVDPNRVVCQHPRATHLDDETMRTIQTLGAGDLERSYLRQAGWWLTGPDQKPFLELAMPDVESDQGWFTDYQFHQPDFESRLRGELAADSLASLWPGWEVTGLEQDESHVRLTLTERETKRAQTLQASFAVGADGASSLVRQHVARDLEDLGGTQRSVIVDVYPFEHPASLPRTTGFIRCEADLPVTYVPLFPPHLRFEFMLSPDQDAHEWARPGHVYQLLSSWLKPGSYRITRTDAYEWHARLVHGWREGRVLLAGDAAHEMPPMLGQGMCSGLRDAMNLAWKLALVVKGASGTELLDTYESERSAHVLPYIVESARQSNMIEAFSHGARPPAAEGAQVVERYRPLLGPGLVAEPAGAVGQLAPQPRGADGARLDDVSGYTFTVVGATNAIAAVDDATRDIWRRLGVVVLEDGGPAVRDWLRGNGAAAAIVRPDRYAFALAKDTAGLATATRALAGKILKAEVPA